MKEIYIRYPITKKIKIDNDEIYDLIKREADGERITIDEVDHHEYLWEKVKELTDDEDMLEISFFHAHDGIPVAEFCV